MIDESRYLRDTLSQILADWHLWACGYRPVARNNRCAMFASAKSTSRQYDSENETTDASLHKSQMKCVDFEIDQLPPQQRTSLGLQARNLVTGYSVWSSARLPTDATERALILSEARAALTERLVDAGVM